MYPGAAVTAHYDTFPEARGLVAGSYGEVSPAMEAYVELCGRLIGEREWRGMGARTAAEAGGIVTTQLRQRLSVVTHAAHMQVLHARLVYVGMAPAAAAARGGGAGGAPGGGV